MNISEAIYEDRLTVLEALAKKLAKEIDDCDSARDLPPLVRQLREVMDEINQIQPQEKQESQFEKLKRQRAQR